MKIISSVADLVKLDGDLSKYIMSSCVWLTDEWQPESTGYIFIIDDRDIGKLSSVCVVPHVSEEEDMAYRQLMTIDLVQYDLWEFAVFDSKSGYWEIVAILGQEYGCLFFMSEQFVQSLPGLRHNIEKVNQQQ